MQPTPTAPSSTEPHRARGLTRAEVMTAGEVAELLDIPVSTVYYLARHERLPHTRVGRTYRFLRPRIEALLEGEER